MTGPDPFVRIVALDAFPDTGVLAVVINGWHVLVARTATGFHAMNDRCSHAASPLSGGRFRHGTIMCPLHGARFDLASGKCIGGAHRDVRTFAVREVDGWIEVAIPAGPPGLDERPVVPV